MYLYIGHHACLSICQILQLLSLLGLFWWTNCLTSVSSGDVTSYHDYGCLKSVETLEQTSKSKNKIMNSQIFQPNEYSIWMNFHSTNEQNKSFNYFKLFNWLCKSHTLSFEDGDEDDCLRPWAKLPWSTFCPKTQ